MALPWMSVAIGEIGQSEIKGIKHNPRILEYFRSTTYRATTDETPWCSAYVSWVLEQCGIQSTRSAAAISYAKWGEPTDPRYGAVCVLKRFSASNPNAAHVGFYLRHNDNGSLVQLLGGNQSNKVCEAWYAAADVLGYRWPKDFPVKKDEEENG